MRLLLLGAILASVALSASGQTVAEVVSNLIHGAQFSGGVGDGSVAEFTFSVLDTNLQEIRVDTYGDRLKEERVFNTNSPAGVPYVSITEVYSANDYEAFRAGGRTAGQHVKSEAERYSEPVPVLGMAVFSSKYFQGQLLSLLHNASVSSVQYQGKPATEVAGVAVFKGRKFNLALTFDADDYTLREVDSSFDGNKSKVVKLIGILSTETSGFWPYEAISAQTWSNGRLVLQTNVPCSAKQVSGPDVNAMKNFDFPTGTIVTDKRYGYGVVYAAGKNMPTDADIEKMSIDPDFHTNSFYLNYYHIVPQPTDSQTVNVSKRIAILGIVLLAAILPLAAALRRKLKSE